MGKLVHDDVHVLALLLVHGAKLLTSGLQVAHASAKECVILLADRGAKIYVADPNFILSSF